MSERSASAPVEKGGVCPDQGITVAQSLSRARGTSSRAGVSRSSDASPLSPRLARLVRRRRPRRISSPLPVITAEHRVPLHVDRRQGRVPRRPLSSLSPSPRTPAGRCASRDREGPAQARCDVPSPTFGPPRARRSLPGEDHESHRVREFAVDRRKSERTTEVIWRGRGASPSWQTRRHRCHHLRRLPRSCHQAVDHSARRRTSSTCSAISEQDNGAAIEMRSRRCRHARRIHLVIDEGENHRLSDARQSTARPDAAAGILCHRRRRCRSETRRPRGRRSRRSSRRTASSAGDTRQTPKLLSTSGICVERSSGSCGRYAHAAGSRHRRALVREPREARASRSRYVTDARHAERQRSRRRPREEGDQTQRASCPSSCAHSRPLPPPVAKAVWPAARLSLLRLPPLRCALRADRRAVTIAGTARPSSSNARVPLRDVRRWRR